MPVTMARERQRHSGNDQVGALGLAPSGATATPGKRTLVETAASASELHAPSAVQRQTRGATASTPSPATAGASLQQLFGRPVQRRGQPSDAEPAQIHAAAARGTATPATALPFADRIQAAFGPRHPVASIQAHVGGAASESAGAMGASAYATGNHVVFANAPDLHTAAHEAAHAVQQAHGVNLYGGVGQAGDAHERHADAVADAVVTGRSAAPLLDQYSAGAFGGGSGVQHQAVQRAIQKPGEPGHYTVSEVQQEDWYQKLGSLERQQYIEQLVGEPVKISNLTVEQALEAVDAKHPQPKPASKSMSIGPRSDKPKSTKKSIVLKAEPMPEGESWFDDFDDWGATPEKQGEPRPASKPMSLGPSPSPSRPMSLGPSPSASKPAAKDDDVATGWDDWEPTWDGDDQLAKEPRPTLKSRSPATASTGSLPIPVSRGPAMTMHPRFGISMSAPSEVDLRDGKPITADVKSEDKEFIREGGDRVWATSKAESSHHTIKNEYAALDLIRSMGVLTVLDGNLTKVRTTKQSTIGFPMQWVQDGISSKSQSPKFLDQLEKLSDDRLAAARQDIVKIIEFLRRYAVRDFQAILDPVSGHILVNDPRGCKERTPSDSTTGDLNRATDWLSRAGSKPVSGPSLSSSEASPRADAHPYGSSTHFPIM